VRGHFVVSVGVLEYRMTRATIIAGDGSGGANEYIAANRQVLSIRRAGGHQHLALRFQLWVDSVILKGQVTMKWFATFVVPGRYCLLAMLLTVPLARSAAWPQKPMRLIVASAVGSGDDLVARTIEPSLSKLLGQQVVIYNRAGAAGWIGQRLAMLSAPDGYNWLLAGGSMAGARYGNSEVNYDVRYDFTPVSLVEVSAFVLVVQAGMPVQNLKEFITLARSMQGKLNFSTGGPGQIPHWSALLFNQMAGIKATEVAYRDFPQGVVDVMAENNRYVFAPFGLVSGNLARLRALGVTSAMRSPAFPEIPTIAEAGVPGYELPAWRSVMGPAGVSKEIVAVLNTALARVLAATEVRERLKAAGSEASPSTPAELSRRYADWVERFAQIARQAGIKPM
jgi:tripartite-type tricarboxylate transporter receptor subunit TctC